MLLGPEDGTTVTALKNVLLDFETEEIHSIRRVLANVETLQQRQKHRRSASIPVLVRYLRASN